MSSDFIMDEACRSARFSSIAPAFVGVYHDNAFCWIN
jgi:hypothetical protein